MNSTMKLRIAAGAAVCGAIGGVAPLALASNETQTEVVAETIVETGGEGANFTVVACPPGETPEAHERHTKKKTHTTSRSHVVIKQDNGDGEVYELQMTDGDFIIFHNGAEVHKKHIKRFPGKILLLSDEGDELTTFELEGMRQAPEGGKFQKHWVGKDGKRGNITIQGDVDFEFGDSPDDSDMRFAGDHPSVMLGIRMGEPGPALRYHLGLGDLQAILVEDVIDGMAAFEAGLHKYDVIISIDGSDEANGQVLNRVLSKKSPGDELRMFIMRGCDKIRLTADLKAYNADKLSANNSQLETKPYLDENVFKYRAAPKIAQGRPFVWSDNRGELLHLLHDKLKGSMSDEQLEHTRRALQEALGGMDFEFGPDSGGMGVMEFKWDGKDRKLVFPKFRDREAGYLLELMPQLERKIELHTEHAERKAAEIQERLSERLERLSEEIERLREALDDLD